MAMSTEQITFVQLSTSAVADSLNGSVATFNNSTIATPPIDFPQLRKKDFKVFLNNRRIPDAYVLEITQNGSNIDVTVNVAGFLEITDATFESDDEVLLIGKFS